MESQKYVTTNDAARQLGLTRGRVIVMINSGIIKARRTGRDWFIAEEEVTRVSKLNRPAGRPAGRKNHEKEGGP